MTFQSLRLIDPILTALQQEGYTTPTPIQLQAIPAILEGKDLLGCAQTGTGKTAAFAIPVLQQLNLNKPKIHGAIRALVLTPTRELAIQIDESFKAYGRNLKLKHTVVFGGVSQLAQTKALRAGIDILVATPGRLLDLMNQGYIHLNGLEILILDEADRMLDMGFIHDVKKVLKVVPAKRQTLFFSATMPAEIVKLSDSILTKPVMVQVTPVSSTAETIQQYLYYVNKADKPTLLDHLLQDRAIVSALVFTRTKHGADKVTKFLNKKGIKSEAIHGNKSQNARQNALNNFKSGVTRILVATDIAARGIDVDNLTHVINYEIPNISETYVHRIGRTGRAGSSGVAISMCEAEEKAYVRDIEKLINMRIPIKESTAVTPMDVSHAEPAKRPVQRASGAGNHNQPKPQGEWQKKKKSFYGNRTNGNSKPQPK